MTDIIDFGPDKPPWRPSRRLIIAAVVVLALAAAVAAVVASADRMGTTRTAPSVPGSCPPPGPASEAPAALLIGCAAGNGLDRLDPTAEDGPWTVVVRRAGGSLGRQGAVVTFPVDALPGTARRVRVGTVPGRAEAGAVVWPVGGAHARIRGDLTEAELVAIATDTTVVGGRPATNPPAGYLVAGGGPYASPSTHEVRYGSADVGEAAVLGHGLTVTGVLRGGGFEDQLYATGVTPGTDVGRRPSVLTGLVGGNCALAWEPAPGVVAYVSYSGAEKSEQTVAALHRLAQRTRPLTDAQWRALRPQGVEQVAR